MKKIGTILTAASGTFALVPGIAVLITEVGVPPGTSSVLYATVMESLGVLCLLILWLNKDKLQQLTVKSATRMTILLGVSFFVFLILYLQLFGFYVISTPGSESLLFPLWPQGELASGLAMYESKIALIREWGRDDVYNVISESSNVALQWSKMVFLLVYVIMFISLTLSFGILGVHVKEEKKEN